MSGDALLTVKAVSARVSFHPSWIRALVRQGKFPRPVHVGRAARWSQEQVSEWIEARKAEARTSYGDCL